MAAAPAAEARIDECFHADAALLERLLSEAVSRGADFADLYFERREE